MVDVSFLQSLSYVAAAIGVCVAAFYYMLVLREQRKNTKLTLETRQAQLFMQIYNAYNSRDFQQAYGVIMDMKFDNFDDFYKKYWNREYLDVMNKYSTFLEGMGILLYNNLIDKMLLYDLTWAEVLNTDKKFRRAHIGEIIREKNNQPDLYKYQDFLCEEFYRIYESKFGRKFS